MLKKALNVRLLGIYYLNYFCFSNFSIKKVKTKTKGNLNVDID